MTCLTALVPVHSGAKGDSKVSRREEDGSVRKTGDAAVGDHADRLRRGSWPPAVIKHAIDDRLENPSCQSRAPWDIVEGLVRLLKVFTPLQSHRFHHFPCDPKGF